MPLLFLERFPWPSLQTYTALSTVLLAGSILSAYTAVTQPGSSAPGPGDTQSDPIDDIKVDQTDSFENIASSVLLYLISDSLFVWVCELTLLCCF